MANKPLLNPADYDLENGTLLGSGSVGLVSRCRHRTSGEWYAVKILSKVQVLQQRRLEGVMAEKEALYLLGPHPNIVYLHGTMQSEDELYFVMDLLPKGDLLEHIRRVVGKRTEQRAGGENVPPCLSLRDARLVTAQLVVALQHCFSRGIALRDVKPENIMFGPDGRVVLVDFDSVLLKATPPVSNDGEIMANEKAVHRVSEVQETRRRTSTFCGTAHYVSPEALGECRWSFASDLFALGGVVYHMLAGTTLFTGPNSYFVMRDIRAGVTQKAFADGVTRHPVAEGFVRSLTHPDPTRRLGVVPDPEGRTHVVVSVGKSGEEVRHEHPLFVFDPAAIRQHPFLDGVDWAALDVPAGEARAPASMPRPAYDEDPLHTDDYASYVHRVGDGPMERFAELMGGLVAPDGTAPDLPEAPVPDEPLPPQPEPVTVDIEDDVGVGPAPYQVDPAFAAAVAAADDGEVRLHRDD